MQEGKLFRLKMGKAEFATFTMFLEQHGENQCAKYFKNISINIVLIYQSEEVKSLEILKVKYEDALGYDTTVRFVFYYRMIFL